MILKNSDFKTHTQAHTLFKIQQIAQVPLPLYLFLSIILCKAGIRGEGRNIWSTPPRAQACTRTVQQSNVCLRNFPYTHTHKFDAENVWKLQSYVRTSSVYVIFHCTIYGYQNTGGVTPCQFVVLRTRDLHSEWGITMWAGGKRNMALLY